jgi:hypothetical protein
MEGDFLEDTEVESPESTAMKRLLAAAKVVASRFVLSSDLDCEAFGELEQAIEDADSLFESDDPKTNGWVGDDGLP